MAEQSSSFLDKWENVIDQIGKDREKGKRHIFTMDGPYPPPDSSHPDIMYYLGWFDIHTTHAKILQRPGAITNLLMLQEDLLRAFQQDLCPNGHYQIGIEDAMDVVNERPTTPLKPYHEHAAVTFFRPAYPPESCDVCRSVLETLLYVEEGPAANHLVCGESCLQRLLFRYLEDNSFIRLFAAGQVVRPAVHLDLPVSKLKELWQTLSPANVWNEFDDRLNLF